MTSDSISARPMIIASRMAGAALGLRAMPSHAAAIARPWPMAPAAAAMPRTNPAPITPQRMTPDAGPVTGCAKAEPAATTSTSATMTYFILLIPFPPFPDSAIPSNIIIDCISDWISFSSVVLSGYGADEVNHRQHDEDKGLQEGAEDAQAHHRPGNHEWEHAHEDARGGMFTEDVAEEADAQRENARKVTDHLDRKHQRRQQRDRPHEVFDVVTDALGANSLHVVVEERADGQAEGGVGLARGRLQAEEQPEHVGDEDEAGKAADDGEIPLTGAVPDDVLDEVFERGDGGLEDVLKRSGVVLAETARGQREEHAADDQHQEGHDHVVRNVPRPAMLERVPQHVDRAVEN